MAKQSVQQMVDSLESKGYESKFSFYMMPADAAERQDIKALKGKMGTDGAFMFLMQMLPDGLRSIRDGALYVCDTTIPHDPASYAAVYGYDEVFVSSVWAFIAKLGLIHFKDGVAFISDPNYWYGEAVGIVCRRANEANRNQLFNSPHAKAQRETHTTARPVKSGSRRSNVQVEVMELPLNGGKVSTQPKEPRESKIKAIPTIGKHDMSLNIYELPMYAQQKVVEMVAEELSKHDGACMANHFYRNNDDNDNDSVFLEIVEKVAAVVSNHTGDIDNTTLEDDFVFPGDEDCPFIAGDVTGDIIDLSKWTQQRLSV